MHSKTLAVRIQQKIRFDYKWIIVILSMLMVFFSAPGQSYFLSAFTDHFIQSFGLTRTQVSLYYSLATLAAGLTLGGVGKLVDKYGQRFMTLIIASLLAATCVFNGLFLKTGWMLIGSFFLLRLLGQGSMVLLPSTLVPNWFEKDRAIALSYVAIGAAIGSFAVPLLHAQLFELMNWQSIWLLWATLLIGLFLPIVYAFMHNKPEDIGLSSDESAVVNEEQKLEKNLEMSFNEAIKTRTFWLLTICTAIPAFINTGLFIHIISIMKWNGMDAKIAMVVMSIIGIGTFLATVPAGHVLERIKEKHVMAAVFLLQAGSIVLLMFTKNSYMAIGFAVLTGVITGFQNVIRRVVWPNYYGKKSLGSISGFTMTAVVIGSAISPLLMGFSYDHLGGYSFVLKMMVVIPLVGAAMASASPKPIRAKS